MAQILLKRAYEPASPSDGFRVFVDRLWPRGLSHETFHYDLWEKQIAPTNQLREWFHADPANRWDEFQKRYTAYLLTLPAWTQFVNLLRGKQTITLLFASHDTIHNQAAIIATLLRKALGKQVP